MKNTFILLIGLLLSLTASSQSCLPDGISFTSQSQIDSFQINHPNCTQIEGEVLINGSAITNLDGLSVVTSVTGPVSILSNVILTSLMGLENLSYIGGGLIIQYNDSLTSLAGLEGLTSIEGGIWFRYNKSLASLSGLDNVTSFGSLVWIADNDTLSICAVQSICDHLAGAGNAWIENNAIGCNSRAEVEVACGVSVEDLNQGNSFSIYPNPSTNHIIIEMPGTCHEGRLSIMNLHGEKLLTRQIKGPKIQLDISNLPHGVYFVRLTNDRTVQEGKFMKQ